MWLGGSIQMTPELMPTSKTIYKQTNKNTENKTATKDNQLDLRSFRHRHSPCFLADETRDKDTLYMLLTAQATEGKHDHQGWSH